MKSVKKDIVGIPPLSESGQIIDDDKEKAECFNNYFKSVFSKPVNDAPFPMYCTTLHLMAEAVISPEGNLHLFGSLKEIKTHEPDFIPNKTIKECSGLLSNSLYVL